MRNRGGVVLNTSKQPKNKPSLDKESQILQIPVYTNINLIQIFAHYSALESAEFTLV